MTVWFVSDTHFSHKNIIKYCDRPFKDIDHMNEALVNNWNEVVMPEDTVFHLGDVALGPIAESLPIIKRLNGYKVLIPGNHDRPFINRDKDSWRQWQDAYEGVFQEVFIGTHDYLDDPFNVVISHFPYDGDSQAEERYADDRPLDDGIPLIHGHTHSTDTVTFSRRGTVQIHVGVDARSYRPVAWETIKQEIDSAVR